MLNEPQPKQAQSIRNILLYGNSILIAGLASKLQLTKDWNMTQVDSGCIEDLGSVNVIVYDMRDSTITETLPKLRGLPGVTLISLDALTDTVTIVTGQSHPAHSMQDILDVLKKAL